MSKLPGAAEDVDLKYIDHLETEMDTDRDETETETEDDERAEPYIILMDTYQVIVVRLVGKCQCGNAMVIVGEHQPGVIDKVKASAQVTGKCSSCDHPISLRRKLIDDSPGRVIASNAGPNRHERRSALAKAK